MSDDGRTAFVTGGSGFIGGRLIERLVADGWQVRALPYSSPGGAADSAVERYAPPGPPDATEEGLEVSVGTAYVDEDLSGPAVSPPTGQMRVEVSVGWDTGSYSTVGVVSGEPP